MPAVREVFFKMLMFLFLTHDAYSATAADVATTYKQENKRRVSFQRVTLTPTLDLDLL